MRSLTIGNSVTSIGENAFLECYHLPNVTIPDSVTSIGEHAFDECSDLTRISFGSGISAIYDHAFHNCTNCAIFDFRKSTSVPTLDGVYAFYNTPADKEIIVPDALYDFWIASPNWSSTENDIVNCIVKASESSLGALPPIPTTIRYTNASGLSNWRNYLAGEISGSSYSPYYTT